MPKKFLHRLLLALSLGVACASAAHANCVSATRGLDSMQPATIQIQNNRGELLSLDVLVADENFERAAGFQHICPQTVDKTLILFVFEGPRRGAFHMHNVHAPLDIGFFDAQGLMVKSMLMETYTSSYAPLYEPDAEYRYALESRAGFFLEHGLFDGNARLFYPQTQ